MAAAARAVSESKNQTVALEEELDRVLGLRGQTIQELEDERRQVHLLQTSLRALETMVQESMGAKVSVNLVGV